MDHQEDVSCESGRDGGPHVHLEPQKVTLCRNSVFTDAIVKMRSYWIGGGEGPQSNDWFLYQKREIWTQNTGRAPCENGQRCSEATTGPGAPRIAGAPGSRERAGGWILPQSPPEGTHPVDTPILIFWPPQLQDNEFLLFEAPQSVVFCYGSARKLI